MKRRTTRVTEDSVKSAIAEAANSRKAGEADAKKPAKPERGSREAAERAKKFQDLREEAMKRWRKRPD